MAGQKLTFGILGKSCNNIISEAVDIKDMRIVNFKDCDIVYGPDGTAYEPKFIISVVEDAISIINKINEGVIKDFLAALPIVYTFYVPTMATDGGHIFINPGFVMQLLEWCDESPVGVAFVILHEVYHNIFKHKEREAQVADKVTDHYKANIAQDYEINWVIEHSYPDKIIFHDMEDEDLMDSDLVDENGNRAQLFAGITELCKGNISEKFRNMVWEDIYDEMDSSDMDGEEPEEEKDGEVELVFSPDYESGFRDGVEDAIRALRAKGLVESAKNIYNFMRFSLFEAKKQVQIDGTYNDGYNEGYNRVISMIEQLLNGGGGGAPAGGNQGGVGPSEAPIKNLPKIKLKFTPPAGAQTDDVPSSNVPEIELSDDAKKQGQGQSQGQSKGQGDGQGNGQGQGQGQSKGQGQGQGNGSGKDGDYSDANNDTGTPGQLGNGAVGNSANNTRGTDAGNNSSTGNIGDGSQSSSQGGESIESLRKAVQGIRDISGTQKPKVVGTSGGYSGKNGAGAGEHIISKEEGQKLAAEAGYNDGSDSETYMGKEDPFNDVDAVRRALKNLKANSTITGSNGTPGCGVFDLVDGVIANIYEPTINWKKTLSKFLKGNAVHLEDIGYGKKGIPYGRYNRIQDIEGESARRLLICIDTSGSVIHSGDYLHHIVANVAEICYKLGVKKINIIQFSDGVYKDTEITKRNLPPASQFAIDANISGGTTFMPVFNYIKKEYTDKHKGFQSVIFFTDEDVYSCIIPKQQTIRWANKIVWFVLTDENTQKLPYGKQLCISPDQFNKQLTNYETNESIETREYMNTKFYKINEAGVFGSYKKAGTRMAKEKEVAASVASRSADGVAASPDEEDSTPVAPKKKLTIMQKRQLAIDAIMQHGNFGSVATQERGNEIYSACKQWMYEVCNVPLYRTKDDIRSYSYSNKNYAYITPWNTIEVVGDIRLMGPNCFSSWPKELVFETVTGTLDIGFDSQATHLPKGLPLKVNGNVRLTNMKKLEDLDGFPSLVSGKVIISACPNIKTLFGAPQRCSFFFSDNFTFEDYIDYVKTTYNKIIESARTKNASKINEAFASNKLSQLFNNPANKEALELGVRKINIMWSEIPDSIIHGIYNNVLEFINLRKKGKNSTSSGYGIYILADRNDKIYVIGTGDNTGRWSGDGGWLYVRHEFIEKLEERRKLAYRANQGYQQEIDECKRLGIKYSKSDVAPKLSRPIITMRDFTWAHLYLVPDLCAKSYIIVGHNNMKSPLGSNKAEDFNYENSNIYRQNLMKERKTAILNTIVQGRNLNPKDPAYRRYFDNYFVTDAKLIENFANVRTIFEIRGYVNSLITAVNDHASKVRKSLIEAHTSGLIDDDIFDGLYALFTQSYIKRFKNDAAQFLEGVDKTIADKKYAENAKYYKKGMQLLYKNPDAWVDIPKKWMKTYTNAITRLAEIMSGLYRATHGKANEVRAEVESYVI